MTDTPEKPKPDAKAEPEIEFDLPESLKGEPAPAAREVVRPPLVTRALLDAQALAAAQTSPARRLIEQEEKRIAMMRNLTASGVMDDVIARAMQHETQMSRIMAGLDTGLFSAGRLADMAALTAPLAQFEKLQTSGDFARLAAQAQAAGLAARAAFGPLAELRASGAFDFLEEGRATAAAFAALGDYERRFVLPDMSGLSDSMRYAAGIGAHLDLQKLAAAMHHPWVDVAAQMRSITGFAELQTLGLAANTLSPFADAMGDHVRLALGDWRDAMTFPATMDLSVRSAFYVERGFRSELTDFPADAFEESLEIAGLGQDEELEAPDPAYVDVHLLGEDADWSAFVRTNRAHLRLMVFEAWLRHFIDVQLAAAFGPDWAKKMLPNGMYDIWVEKREKAEKRGAPIRTIIAYADFTDYSVILTKKDLWPVFAPFFFTPESVRESFNRLHLPRIEVSHARPISQDDELYLRVEIMRLGRAFKLPAS